MADFPSADVLGIKSRLLVEMRDYMDGDEEEDDDEFDCGYSASDVDRCERVIDRFFAELEGCRDEPKILTVVQKVVERLNTLNEDCDGCLIETDQREDLCALILTAAKERGLLTNEDVTEAWREW